MAKSYHCPLKSVPHTLIKVERFHKIFYGQVRAIKLGLAAHLGIHPDSTAARLVPWIIQNAILVIGRTPTGAYSSKPPSENPFYCKTHSRPPSQNFSKNPSPEPLSPFLERFVAVRPLGVHPISSRSIGTSFVRMERPHTSGSSRRLTQVLWNEFWLMFNPSPPPKTLHLRAQPQKHHALWLGPTVGQMCHHLQLIPVRFSKPEVSRLIKEQQFNSVEFSRITLPPHEGEPDYQEPQQDRIALQELLRSFIMQQVLKRLSKDFKPMDQRFEVTVEHAGSLSWLHQPRERINHHHHCQHRHRQPQHLRQKFLNLQQFLILLGFKNASLDFIHCIFIMLNNQDQLNLSSNPSNQISNQFRSEEESQRSQIQLNQQEVAAVIQDIKENHLSIGQDQINTDHQEVQSEEELLQGLVLQEWYQGDLQGHSADQIKSAITEELRQIGPQGHDACDPVPLSCLTVEEHRSITEFRWVTGPRPGSELKGRFCAKGFIKG